MKLKTLFLAAVSLCLVGCNQPLQDVARDSIAGANGILVQAQAKYKTQCEADKSQTPCLLIHDGISANNLAIDSLKLYCNNASPCQVDKAVEPKLKAALQSLNVIMGDVKGLL